MAKKTAKKKRSATKSRGVVAKATKKTAKVGKKMMAKAGLSKAAVKKKVVKKLKRVGVAMARAAMDELMPAEQDQQTPGETGGRSAKGAANPR